MNWSMPMDPDDRAFLARLRQQFSTCCSDIASDSRDADKVATAVAAHIAATTTATLPPAAQPLWTDRVARPLKAEAAKPLSSRSISAIRSWPSSRVGELAMALGEIEAILVDVENEALNVAIYAEISRAYS